MARKTVPTTIGDTDKLMNWLNNLCKASVTNAIITQHKKDKDILKDLGCNNVYRVLEPLTDFVDVVAGLGKPCVLIYDADAKSNKKCEKLKSLLQQRKVKVNTRFRKVLFVERVKAFAGILKHLRRMAGSDRKYRDISRRVNR